MKNRGFTLIELLAVIVILAIIALIAVPIVLNIIKDTKESATLRSAELYMDAVNLAITKASMDPSFPQGEITCTMIASTSDDILSRYDLQNYDNDDLMCTNDTENYEPVKVDIKGDVPTGGTIVFSNGKIAKDDSFELVMNESEVYVYNDSGNIQLYVNSAYNVGDLVTAKDGTSWIITENSGAQNNNVKMMSLLNINNSVNTSMTGTDMFVPESSYSNYLIAFDENNSNIYANSTVKVYLENTVKAALENSLGRQIISIKIWGAEELRNFGCTVTGSQSSGYEMPVCDNTVSWYMHVFLGQYIDNPAVGA